MFSYTARLKEGASRYLSPHMRCFACLLRAAGGHAGRLGGACHFSAASESGPHTKPGT